MAKRLIYMVKSTQWNYEKMDKICHSALLQNQVKIPNIFQNYLD